MACCRHHQTHSPCNWQKAPSSHPCWSLPSCGL